MIRVLLIPSIAHPLEHNNLSDSSYIDFLTLSIDLMQKKRDDIFWYIITPSNNDKDTNGLRSLKKILNFSNTHFIDMNIPNKPLNRIHFDVNELKSKLSFTDYPVDLIFCHQPELIRPLKLFFNKATNLSPPVMGYLHLFELPKIGWDGVFEYNIFGMTEMDSCFLNTSYQKQMVHEEARKIFSSSVCGKLHEKLEVFPPMVIPKSIKPNKKGTYENIIIWNHDVNNKKNFLEFERTILTLRKQRDDFKVWVPFMKKSHKLTKEFRWIITGRNSNRREYLGKMRTCCVGVSPKNIYGDWLGATIDGNSSGVPYIMFNEQYYKDINNGADFYKTRKELISKLNKYLNESDYRNKMAGQTIANLITKYNMNRKIDVLSKRINILQRSKRAIRSKLTSEMVQIIKDKKRISHKELLGPKYLNWESKTKFDGYRKSILNTKGISEVLKISGNRKYAWKVYYQYQDS